MTGTGCARLVCPETIKSKTEVTQEIDERAKPTKKWFIVIFPQT
jgi:hypothetical protein